jgi:hypothetical protein
LFQKVLKGSAKKSLHFRQRALSKNYIRASAFLHISLGCHITFLSFILSFLGRRIKSSRKSRDLHTLEIPQVILKLSHDFPFRVLHSASSVTFSLSLYTVSKRKEDRTPKQSGAVDFHGKENREKKD